MTAQYLVTDRPTGLPTTARCRFEARTETKCLTGEGIGGLVVIPGWYRTVRRAGVAAIALGCLGFVLSFPFISGEPESVTEADDVNPAWFTILGGVCIGLLVFGLILLLLPIAHRALRRKLAYPGRKVHDILPAHLFTAADCTSGAAP